MVKITVGIEGRNIKDGYVTEWTYCSGSDFDSGFLLRHKSGLPEDIVK